MATGLTLTVPPGLTRQQLAIWLAEAVEAAAHLQTNWYLGQWEQGHDPFCCAGCANTRYRPDPVSGAIVIEHAASLFATPERDRIASCQTFAAIHAGHDRAEKIREGMSYARAIGMYPVVVEPQPDVGGKPYMHVVCMTPNGRFDPTEKAVRA